MRTVFLKIKEDPSRDIIAFHGRVYEVAEHYANKNNLTWEYVGLAFLGCDFMKGSFHVELVFTPVDV